jgi:cobalt-zinc-cadmium efflux system protein
MARTSEQRLTLTFSITLLILAAEATGGVISNSLALLSDAGHVFTDAFALGLALIAARICAWPLDTRATYGYHRVGLLAAVVNGLSLVAIAAYIFHESYERFTSPQELNLAVMLPVAVGGLLANLLMAAILGRGHADLNIRSAWLHVLGDTLSSVGVIVSGVVIYYTGWTYADPLAGLLIGLIIVTGGVRVVREALVIFLDLVPRGFDLEGTVAELEKLPDVLGVHDVHVRSVTHGRVSFSAHVWVRDRMLSEAECVRQEIEQMLRERGVGHTLLQFEAVECDRNGLYCPTCSVRPAGLHSHHHH